MTLCSTCSGDLSRNRTVGLQLAAGLTLKEIVNNMNQIAEGVRTTKSVFDLAKKHHVEMPIAGEVYKILYENKCPKAALRDLMVRDLRQERE